MMPIKNSRWARLLAILLLSSGCSRVQPEHPSAPGPGVEEGVIQLLDKMLELTERADDLVHGVPRKASRGAKPELIVEINRITLDGQRLVLEAPVSEWWKVLGPPSRQDRLGEVLVWDSLGIGVTTRVDEGTEKALASLAERFYDTNPTSDEAYGKHRERRNQMLDKAQKSGAYQVSSLYVRLRDNSGPDTDADGEPMLRGAFKGYLQVNGVSVDAETTLREISRWGRKSRHPLFYDCLRLDELRRCSAHTEVVENGPTMDFGFSVDGTEQRRITSFSFSCEGCPPPAR